MNSSLVVVTCFAISFALRSDATARLVLGASLSCIARGRQFHAFGLCEISSFCWMRILVFSFLFTCCCTQSLCCGLVPRCRRSLTRSGGAFLLSFTLVLQARMAPFLWLPLLGAFECSLPPPQARRLEICNIEPGDGAVCSRSASLHLATEVVSARGRASACSGPCCESSSGSSALSEHYDHLLKTL